jgi:hypothetical protein
VHQVAAPAAQPDLDQGGQPGQHRRPAGTGGQRPDHQPLLRGDRAGVGEVDPALGHPPTAGLEPVPQRRLAEVPAGLPPADHLALPEQQQVQAVRVGRHPMVR